MDLLNLKSDWEVQGNNFSLYILNVNPSLLQISELSPHPGQSFLTSLSAWVSNKRISGSFELFLVEYFNDLWGKWQSDRRTGESVWTWGTLSALGHRRRGTRSLIIKILDRPRAWDHHGQLTMCYKMLFNPDGTGRVIRRQHAGKLRGNKANVSPATSQSNILRGAEWPDNTSSPDSSIWTILLHSLLNVLHQVNSLTSDPKTIL